MEHNAAVKLTNDIMLKLVYDDRNGKLSVVDQNGRSGSVVLAEKKSKKEEK